MAHGRLPIKPSSKGFQTSSESATPFSNWSTELRFCLVCSQQLLKGLNYSAQGEGLRLLGYFGDPRVFLIMKDCAVDHLIPRCRRTACGVLASLNYDDKEDANDAYATLQQLVDCEDWTLRYAAIESLLNFKHMHFIEEDLKAKTPGIISGRLSAESEDSELLKAKIGYMVENKTI
mmetsp:Transcript_28259/g.110962  ORF Transcript_28259/g.110962 Transcript_28259/m.110962 type:complete len:176 (-) Transcript_28259:466-993(-)